MEIRERKFDAILLDVDGTLLDFGMSEKQGMKVVLEQYGFEPTEERLLLYHEINEGFWSAFERGEVTKERLVWERFNVFFARLGRFLAVWAGRWTAVRRRNCTAGSWMHPHF